MKEDTPGNRKNKNVQSLERALTLIEQMAEAGRPVTISELSEKTGLKISTVHRLLSPLLNRGYAEQNPETNKYQLGLKLLEVSNRIYSYSDIRTIVRPFVAELVERCNETANLAVLDDTEIVYIDQIESQNYIIVKMFAQVGNRGPVHCTASGKILLAYRPEKEIDDILSRIELKRHTDQTITEPKKLKKELLLAREQGYALDWGEMEEHVRCIAAPIFNYENKPAASIGVSGPDNRITRDYIKDALAGIVTEIAARASARLGYNKNINRPPTRQP